MGIELPEIPYNFADLEPVLSRDALLFHFLHQQRVCFDRMQPLVRGTELDGLALEDIVRATERDPAHRVLHRCAAEVWSHTVYWQSMRPRGGGNAHGAVGEGIRRRFGSFERFSEKFKDMAKSQFGSGWLWLVWHRNSVDIVATANARTPLARVDAVLLGLDLWEHAYYLDYQNRRAAYVNSFLEDLVNWDFANRVLADLGWQPDVRRPVAAARPAAAVQGGRHSP